MWRNRRSWVGRSALSETANGALTSRANRWFGAPQFSSAAIASTSEPPPDGCPYCSTNASRSGRQPWYEKFWRSACWRCCLRHRRPCADRRRPALRRPRRVRLIPRRFRPSRTWARILQTLKRFRVSTELTGERVLADGQKLQHTATADMDVERPNKLRALMHSARSERELVYDGKTVTLYTPAQKYYSTVEFSDTIGGLIDLLEQRYGVELPLSDLFLWGTPAAPLDKIDSAMNAGQDFVGDDLCDHYAFRQAQHRLADLDHDRSKPLPRKIVITNRADEARPQSVSLIDWNLKPDFKDSVFKFTPPKGASKIEIVPVKTK